MNYDNIPDARVRRKLMCRDLKICRECSKQGPDGKLVGPPLFTKTKCKECTEAFNAKAKVRYHKSVKMEREMGGGHA